MKTRITLAQINLNITINRLLFRLKKEGLKDEAKANVEQEIKDLDEVKNTLTYLERQIEKQFEINLRVHAENLALKTRIQELTRKELEI